jgi:hypothetical protein
VDWISHDVPHGFHGIQVAVISNANVIVAVVVLSVTFTATLYGTVVPSHG